MAKNLMFNIDAVNLIHIITELCEVPESYNLMTIHGTSTIKINNRSLLIKAQIQEALRIRFSHPERMTFNQEIIKNATETSNKK